MYKTSYVHFNDLHAQPENKSVVHRVGPGSNFRFVKATRAEVRLESKSKKRWASVPRRILRSMRTSARWWSSMMDGRESTLCRNESKESPALISVAEYMSSPLEHSDRILLTIRRDLRKIEGVSYNYGKYCFVGYRPTRVKIFAKQEQC